jgi:NAD(P)H-hydrate repair Nnr-like enzyme with NAD(P)H-hydrate dehydratase domain
MPAKTFRELGPEQAIRRFVRRRSSSEYFKNGDWTANPEEASQFSDAVEAAEACARYGLDDVELAIRYEFTSHDVFCTPLR